MVLVPNGQTAGPPRGNPRIYFYSYADLSDHGLRQDTRGYYQGVGTSGGLAGLVLPLSKCLVHWDPESDQISRDGGLSPRVMSLSWAMLGHPCRV